MFFDCSAGTKEKIDITVSRNKVTTKTVSDENIEDREEYLNIKETVTHVKINSKPS